MRDVAVIGVGETEFGELWDRSFRDLGIEAGLKAIQDAKLRSEDIDAVYIGNMSAGKFIDQEHVSALVADYSGLADMHLPTVRVEGGGACGAIALLQARLAIASGMHDIVVVGGAEKMTDVGDVQAAEILSSTADQEWESVFGATFAGLYAMMARRHMYEFGTTREQLAAVAVKNHKNGALNPEAQFQKEITIETVLQAPRVAEPLGVFDCAPLSDGAAAVVLCEMQKARKFSDTPIRIAGSGQASDFLALHDRRDLTTLDATVIAGKRAFHEARLQPKDVQVAEVHDNFTISEILAIEDLRFIEKGKGGPATAEGLTALNGKVSVNTSGGLKARGQPVGATGVAQAVEIVRQLLGEAGKRQVVGARHGHGHPRRTGPVRDAEALRDGDHRDGRGRPAHVSIDRRKSRGCYDRDEGPILLPETWPGRGGGRHPLRVQVPARRLIGAPRVSFDSQTPSACSQNRVRSEHLAFMTQHAIPLSGSGGTTKRPRSQAEEASPKPTSPSTRPSSRHGSFARLRTWFRRSPPPALLMRQPVAPSVVLACERCGFDYTVTRIEVGGGKEANIWSCDCGSRYIPPGGVPTSQLVRP